MKIDYMFYFYEVNFSCPISLLVISLQKVSHAA